jgi:hypothetical protein
MNGIEQPALEPIIVRRHVGEMDLPGVEHIGERRAAVLDEVYGNPRMLSAPPSKKRREGSFDHRRRRAKPDQTGIAGLKTAGRFLERIRLEENAPGSAQEPFACSRKKHSPPLSIEEPDPERRLEALQLARKRGLARVEADSGTADPATIDDRDESAKLRQVHGRSKSCMKK